MTTSKWTTALAACDELDALLATAYPAANPGLLAKIRKVVATLQGTGLPYVQTKAGMIASRAEIYLSTQRHTKAPGGADGLMQEMRYRLLSGIREELRVAQDQGGS
ncbi:hypothetical protein [Acidovorax sp. Leaf160]|uniref:hypothetical protein n=1 Tax=Acidovorax sp. Leaf160 TaxID=1736280 RepID=UPI0006FFC973|nr:hypothetical protein [Acidovorax sp. Leaf160]KQR55646.1 hypothetical protein ASF94_04395 [Acidovorax sp. Leaf160]